jgi:hypothetical protein
MKEILPQIYHWTATHPEIGIEVSSYFIAEEGILIDPLLPKEGLEWFKRSNQLPLYVLLTNRLHERHSAQFREAFRCIILVHEAGLGDFTGSEVEGFSFGHELPGKIEALTVDAICPDETALFIPREGGIVAFADGLIRQQDGPLEFVEDELMADTPEKATDVKKGLKTAFRAIAEHYTFEHLFFAHGHPLIGGGQEALRRFVE